jgi:hypothetical protein
MHEFAEDADGSFDFVWIKKNGRRRVLVTPDGRKRIELRKLKRGGGEDLSQGDQDFLEVVGMMGPGVDFPELSDQGFEKFLDSLLGMETEVGRRETRQLHSCLVIG